MKELLLHPATRQHLELFVQSPSQVLVLSGPAGSGKLTTAKRLVETILELPESGFGNYGHSLLIEPEDGKAIGIDAARQLEKFLRLKVPGKRTYDRAVIVENGHLMTAEAQNALLKTLEEPPAGTVIIITVSHEPALLPTVRSRAQIIAVQRPEATETQKFFAGQGFGKTDIERISALSGGLIGLMSALLTDDSHPLRLATEQARQLLSQPIYERLITVDSLAKDKILATNTVDILQRMARLSLQTASGSATQKWQAVLRASYQASEALAVSAQPKLVLTKLVLQF